MAQQLTPEQLCAVLEHTLSLQEEVRSNAERQLNEAQSHPGHALVTLRIVSGSIGTNSAVRQAAAVHFKNLIRNGWDENREEGTDGIVFSAEDRNVIKSHLVELMCTVPGSIQAQCSEAISLIAAVDFPQQWNNLLPDLVQRFNSPDPAVVSGVLVTANSILKRFRYVHRTDALYADLIYCLNIIQAPLLTLFKTTGQAVASLEKDAAQLAPRFGWLRSMCRIFYSLNYQDLPEYFQDHMQEWMEEFAKYLQYQNPVLTDLDEEETPSPIDTLQTAIVQNLDLYTNKDEEEFFPYLENFTTLVWNLLMRLTPYPKHDTLATRSIRFLSSLVKKLMHRALFENEATLREIVTKIVIPNMMIREADRESFEDDPQEFIRTDIEGEDSESRRRCSQELLRAMSRQFEMETTQICSGHVEALLTEYAANPSTKWDSKDAAIHLMLGVAIKAQSDLQGVSEVNVNVNIMDFFTTHIVPELEDANHTVRPMVKATAIKFVTTFRNQFTTEQLTALMPLLIRHLASPSVVVHTYAAYAIDKILRVKTYAAGGASARRFGAAELRPHLQPLLTSLFAIVDNPQFDVNQYVMKCVVTSLSVAAPEDIIPITQIVLERLTAVLARVSKNPQNPMFNHHMFESIAVLVRSVCSQQPEATSSFEVLLFPPFQTVLQMDVSEFTPYVFQVLAQLLEYRPAASGLGEAYSGLFSPLLTPDLWERKGNVPALVRLLGAYLVKAGPELVGQLTPMLGVFQKLVATPATDVSAVDLLCSLTMNIPHDALRPYLDQIFRIVLMRLNQGKGARFRRLATHWFAIFVGKFDSHSFLQILDTIQPGLGLNIIAHVWVRRLEEEPPTKMEAKAQVVALTKLLCDTPILLSSPDGQKEWSRIAAVVVRMLTSSDFLSTVGTAEDEAADMEISYDSTFSTLQFARKPVEDPFPEIPNPGMTFSQSLSQLSASHPGRLQPLLQQGMAHDPKLAAGFEAMLSQNGITLV